MRDEQLVGEEHIAEFLRRIAMRYEKTVNPVFEGHRTTYPGQKPVTASQTVGFAMMYTNPSAIYAVVGHQLLITPGS